MDYTILLLGVHQNQSFTLFMKLVSNLKKFVFITDEEKHILSKNQELKIITEAYQHIISESFSK